MKYRQDIFALVAVLWLAAGLGVPDSALATVGDEGLCWVPDVEFPVPCDDDGD